MILRSCWTRSVQWDKQNGGRGRMDKADRAADAAAPNVLKDRGEPA